MYQQPTPNYAERLPLKELVADTVYLLTVAELNETFGAVETSRGSRILLPDYVDGATLRRIARHVARNVAMATWNGKARDDFQAYRSIIERFSAAILTDFVRSNDVEIIW